MKRLKIAEFVRPPAACHFAVTSITDLRPKPPHTHDFPELFWVPQGRGWHYVNGRKMPLHAGQLVLIRPTDGHAFSQAGATPLTICNLAFARKCWLTLLRRYGAWRDPYVATDIAKRIFDLSGPAWRLLDWAAEELRRGSRDMAALDRFLLNLRALLEGPSCGGVGPAPPGWLKQALIDMVKPENLPGGTKRFVALCGYTAEHVARTVRRLFDCTPTDLVNEIRMNYAVKRLTTMDQDILQIALDCGFVSLSHFYLVFRRHFGVAPRKYRRQQRSIVGVTEKIITVEALKPSAISSSRLGRTSAGSAILLKTLQMQSIPNPNKQAIAH